MLALGSGGLVPYLCVTRVEPLMSKVYNFSAGPAILPKEAIDEAIEGLKEYKDTGLSVVEISHRSKAWEDQMEEAEALVRELYNVNDDYHVLFLQGGASTQFGMIPMNVLRQDETAAYLDTGSWSSKAIKDAKLYGKINVVASSKNSNYNYIPKDYTVDGSSAYFHITTNNTIFGTEIHNIPEVDVPIVADMSSDIFSRPLDMTPFSIIYAGAQKNMGPAGATLVIIRKDMIERAGRELPAMLNYKNHAEKDSMYNTPPVFSIYLSYLTLKWLKNQGGLSAIHKKNMEKANLLYDEVSRNPLFEATAAKEDRSLMNATFVTKEASDEARFAEYAEKNGIYGLEGHRSVGGFRASMYNAMDKSTVEHLVELMQEFEKKN